MLPVTPVKFESPKTHQYREQNNYKKVCLRIQNQITSKTRIKLSFTATEPGFTCWRLSFRRKFIEIIIIHT